MHRAGASEVTVDGTGAGGCEEQQGLLVGIEPAAAAASWPIFNIPYAYFELSGQGSIVSR